MRPIKLLILFFLLPAVLRGQIITTVAGNGVLGYSGDGGPAINAALNYFAGVGINSAGDIYIADANNHRIRKVDILTGIITTVAGNGVVGYGGDNGLGTAAQLNLPGWVAIHKSGDLYVSDQHNHRIRKVAYATGIITTVAGNGVAGFSGDSNQAIGASLYNPQGIAFDPDGNLYIADVGNQRVRRVDTFGIITTIAGTGNIGYGGDNGPAVLAEMMGIYGICTDKFSNVYVVDQNNNRVRKINTVTGIITTVAGNGTAGFSGDGMPADSAQLDFPIGVAVDTFGNIFIGDQVNNRVRKVDVNGVIHSVVGTGVSGFGGDGGLADTAKLYRPQGLALDICGNLYIADKVNKRVRKVEFNPTCSLIDTTDTTTVVRGTIALNKIEIYPNPAREQLTVAGGSDIKEVTLVNTMGQVVLGQSCNGNKAVLNVQGLQSGVYFVVVRAMNGEKIVKKIIKV